MVLVFALAKELVELLSICDREGERGDTFFFSAVVSFKGGKGGGYGDMVTTASLLDMVTDMLDLCEDKSLDAVVCSLSCVAKDELLFLWREEEEALDWLNSVWVLCIGG